MEYVWIAAVTAMIAQSAFWMVLMYLFLFYACRKIEQSGFSNIAPWTLVAIGVCVIGSFVPHFLPQYKIVQLCFSVIQEALYFYIWYRYLKEIRSMEAIYGDLGGYGLRRVYWVEMLLAAWALGLFAASNMGALEQSVEIMLVLVQGWKAYLLYYTYRNYTIREEQLVILSQEADESE